MTNIYDVDRFRNDPVKYLAVSHSVEPGRAHADQIRDGRVSMMETVVLKRWVGRAIHEVVWVPRRVAKGVRDVRDNIYYRIRETPRGRALLRAAEFVRSPREHPDAPAPGAGVHRAHAAAADGPGQGDMA